tara:strand:- start:1344 stop:1574 length:231 start_codon:yes stop_codon:yes gene_type:complete
MILKKIVIGFFLITLFSGCAQNVGLLAPAYTFANTGSVYHAGLSYGSNKVVKSLTGRTTAENIQSFVSENKDNKVD